MCFTQIYVNFTKLPSTVPVLYMIALTSHLSKTDKKVVAEIIAILNKIENAK